MRPSAAPRRMFSLFFPMFLHIWANILVLRMLALPTRMLTPQHPGSILVQLQACSRGRPKGPKGLGPSGLGPRGETKGLKGLGPWGNGAHWAHAGCAPWEPPMGP